MKTLKQLVISHQLRKVYNKNHRIESSVYKQTLINTKKVMIIYPTNKDEERNADNILRILFNYFENSKFTIVKPTDMNKKVIGFFGFPKPIYFDEFRQDFPFDVVIDLNTKFNKIATYIVGMMDSKLNIRLYKHEKSDSVYNLSICTPKEDLTAKIVTMKTYLDRIKSTFSLA